MPKVGASCGIPPEALRRIAFGIKSSVYINADYSLQSNVAITDLHFIDPCRVTFLNIDISGLITREAIGRMPLADINNKIGQVNFRAQAEQIWNTASTPIKITDGLFFNLRPESWGLTTVGGQGQTALFNLGFTAHQSGQDHY